jgi:hypothetical protein
MQGFFKNKQTNIFRNLNKKINYISYLNLLYTDIYYEKTNNDTIIKVFFNKNTFDWELYIILTLESIGLEIFPKILNVSYNTTSSIEFDVKNLIPLRKLFKNNNYNVHLIINELISFIRNIQLKKIIINNLHIDSIYVNLNIMKFYILDLSNTSLTDSTLIDTNLQSLYISLHEANVNDKVIKYLNQEMVLFNKNL